MTEVSKRSDNYKQLKVLGYGDEEIFAYLGNVNFLTKKYKNAFYWYGRLM